MSGCPAGPAPGWTWITTWKPWPQPTLYLHGTADGCISVDLVRNAEHHLGPDSTMKVIQGAGHFLHVEQPAEVNRHILAWVTS